MTIANGQQQAATVDAAALQRYYKVFTVQLEKDKSYRFESRADDPKAAPDTRPRLCTVLRLSTSTQYGRPTCAHLTRVARLACRTQTRGSRAPARHARCRGNPRLQRHAPYAAGLTPNRSAASRAGNVLR